MNFKKLHDHNPDAYFLKICEELAELQVAILHYRDGKVKVSDVEEEIADVQIQLVKIMYWLGDFNIDKCNEVFDMVNLSEHKKSYQLEKIIEGME